MFNHTRNKHWEKGRFYITPCLRIHWETENEYSFKTNKFEPKKHFRLDFCWFFIRISIP